MKSAGHCSAKFSGPFGGPELVVNSTGPATLAHKIVQKMSHQIGTTNFGTPDGPPKVCQRQWSIWGPNLVGHFVVHIVMFA